MASKAMVAKCLAMMSRSFAGEVDDERVRLYHAAFDDLDDAQIERATTIVVRQWTGAFIPPPAVIRAAVAPAAPAVDAGALARRISKLGFYHPTGWVYPRIDKVRDELGEVVAYAYAAAGRERLYAENDTTRDIAEREFEKSLIEGMKRAPNGLPVIGAPAVPSLPDGADGEMQLIHAADGAQRRVG